MDRRAGMGRGAGLSSGAAVDSGAGMNGRASGGAGAVGSRRGLAYNGTAGDRARRAALAGGRVAASSTVVSRVSAPAVSKFMLVFQC